MVDWNSSKYWEWTNIIKKRGKIKKKDNDGLKLHAPKTM